MTCHRLTAILSLLFSLLSISAVTDNAYHVNPDIARDSSGYYYVTWFDRTSENILLQKFNASGVNQWVNPTQVNIYNLATLTGWDQEPQIAIDGSTIYVVWAQSPGVLSMMKLNSSGNRLWASEPNVNSEPNEYVGHDIAVDSNGYIYVNYREYGPYGGSSYLSKVNWNGLRQWGNDVLSGQGGYSGKQAIAIGPNNEIYCYSTHSGTSWLHRFDTNGNKIWGIQPGTGGSIAVESTGRLVLAGRSGSNVILKKYNSSGSQYGGNITVSSGADAKYPFVSLDNSNNAYVVWQDERAGNNGYDFEVMANTINSSGSRLWSTDKLVNAADLAEHYNPACVADQAGGVMVAWHNAISGSYENIHINRLNASGNRLFANDINIHGSVGGGNNPPSITSNAVTVMYVDKINNYQVTAIDPDGDNLTYSVTQGPNGYSIHPTSGLVTFTPGGSIVGNHAVNIRVVDGNGGVDNQSFTLKVKYPVEANRTSNSITHAWSTINFQNYFGTPPVAISQVETYDGGDPCGTRMRSLGNSSIQVMVEEEASKDTEVAHTTEVVSYALFEAGDIIASNGAVIGEAGKFSINQANGTTWYTRNLSRSYSNPVVIMGIETYNGGHQTHMRMKNITSNSFQYQQEEWDYHDGAHTTETISYVVLEAGNHHMGDGTLIQAGKVNTSHTWLNVNFSQSFGQSPITLSQCQTYNGSQAANTRQRNVAFNRFEVRLQEEEGNDGSHATETIGFIAIDPA